MRRALTILMLMAALAVPAHAATLAEAVVAELVAKGYADVDMTRTWLGRIVITGELDGRTREITLNPKTGEILRDYFRSRVAEADSSSSGQGASAAGVDRSQPASSVRTSGAVEAASPDGAVSTASEGSGVLLDSVVEGAGE